MMLQALIAYAERKNLGDAYFEPSGVRWAISVDQNGRLVSPLIQLTESSDKKKPRPQRKLRPKSDPDFVSHGRSYFLCDSLARSVFFVDDEANLEKRRVNQTYFVELIREASKNCPKESKRLSTLASFLANEGEIEKLHKLLKDEKASETDNAIFFVEGFNFLDSPEIKAFWEQRCKKTQNEIQSEEAVCLATGKLGPICRTTGFIKGLKEDTKLISFNKECPAFESFDLQQAANAAVSADAELKFRSALDFLINKSREQKLGCSGVYYVHWTRQDQPFDPTNLLADADTEAIAHLLTSAKEGRRYLFDDADAYYAASLSSNGPRLVVRDWLVSTAPIVKANVARWFEDLCIVTPDGQDPKCEFSLWELLGSIIPRKNTGKPDWDKLPAQMASETFFSAIRGDPDAALGYPLPLSILGMALRRQLVEFRGTESKFDPKLNPARIALIKAYLIRSPNRKETDTMTSKLDPESKDPAYLCGALFAVIGRLQLLALGKVGASIADRTYGGVATRPATTLGPIFTKLPPYVKKANARFPGCGTNRQKEIEDLCCRIEALGGIRQTLGLEEQGRFALGYYCRLAQYRTDRAEAEAAEKAAKLEDEQSN
jgi:CRISPR-associated protein Csd1